jgi:hypothetical protein
LPANLPADAWVPAMAADGADEREHAGGRAHRVRRSLAGPPARACSYAVSSPTPGPSSPSATSTATVPGAPHRPGRRRRLLRGPSIAGADAPSAPSATPRRPDLPTSPRPTSPSTAPGSSSCSSPVTSWPGAGPCAWKASWPPPPRDVCATACSMPPGSSCTAPVGSRSAWPRAGPSAISWWPPSPECRAGRSRPEQRRAPRAREEVDPARPHAATETGSAPDYDARGPCGTSLRPQDASIDASGSARCERTAPPGAYCKTWADARSGGSETVASGAPDPRGADRTTGRGRVSHGIHLSPILSHWAQARRRGAASSTRQLGRTGAVIRIAARDDLLRR